MPVSPVLTLEGFSALSAIQTDTVLIAAQPGKRISVYQAYISGATAVLVTFKSGTRTVWQQYVGEGGGAVIPYTGIEWFVTDAGQALTYTTSAAIGHCIAVKAASV